MTPDPATPPVTKWVFRAQALRYTQILRLLFSHPMLGCGLLRLRNFWPGTLLVLALVALLGGGLTSLNLAPEYGADIRRGSTFILQETGGFRVEEERLRWEKENPLPAPRHLTLAHGTVSLSPSWQDFTPPESPSQEKGVVFCPEGVGLWMASPEGDEDTRFLALPAFKLAQSAFPGLAPDSQDLFCRFVFLVLCGCLMFLHCLDLLRLALTTGVALAIVWLFLLPGRRLRLLPHFLLRGLNMTIPPLLATLLWNLAGIPFSLDTTFTLLLLLYVLYASIEGRGGVMTTL
ncbi:MAG: hypothetical protein ACI4SG_07500 [Oligosphaeraceae bacterium]